MTSNRQQHVRRSAPLRTYTCNWCGMVSEGTSLSCPACGAPVNVKDIVSLSGWVKLPAIKSMAKLQFGQSFCQVEGTYAPVADMSLAPRDGVYFTHHVLLWKDSQVTLSAMPLDDAWKRMFAGMPLVMLQAQGPGHVAFSQDAPGEIIALPLHSNQSVDVREHVFMVATNQVAYDYFNPQIWFATKDGSDRELHFPLGLFMDRFFAPKTPGLLLLHGAGNVFVRQLAPGETILVKPTTLLFKDSTVEMHLRQDYPANQGTHHFWRTWYQRYIWLQLYGPGRVAIQSAYEQSEDNGKKIVGSSPMSM